MLFVYTAIIFIYIGTFDPKYDTLLEAVKAATNEGIKVFNL